MKTVFSFKIVLLMLMITIFTGCQLQEVPFTKVLVRISLPDDALQAGENGYTVILTNIATGRKLTDTTDNTGVLNLTAEEGVYNVEVTGQKDLKTIVTGGTTQETYTQHAEIRGLLEKSLVKGEQVALNVTMQIAQKGNGFVIQEVYYTGSTTPANGHYYQDQYIEIFNNSDSVLYADGLSVLESNHLSTSSVIEYSNYPNDLIVGAIYTIPGEGKTYPVQPGKSLVIASLGINHKTANANSPVDLEKEIGRAHV